MEKTVTEVSLANLRYIDFQVDKTQSSFSIKSRRLSDRDKDVHQKQWFQFADKLWDNSLELLILLGGFDRKYIYPSRWKMDDYCYVLDRRFNSPQWQDRPYMSCDGYIHLRDSFFIDRSIDDDFIDLFLTFSSDPYATSHSPIDNNEQILSLLQSWQPQLTNVLTNIAQTVLADQSIQVTALYPVWEEECVIESGADGYWIKGVIS